MLNIIYRNWVINAKILRLLTLLESIDKTDYGSLQVSLIAGLNSLVLEYTGGNCEVILAGKFKMVIRDGSIQVQGWS